MAAETSQPGQTPSVPLTLDQYLAIAQAGGASDLHLGVHAPPIWRLHGTLLPIWPDAPSLTAQDTATLAESFLSDLHQTQLTERGVRTSPTANDLGSACLHWCLPAPLTAKFPGDTVAQI